MRTAMTFDEISRPLTEEEKRMIDDAAARPIEPDEDCPETTPEQFARYRELLAQRKARSKTQIVSLRLKEETLNKARLLGSGYTGVLGRILEYGLNDPEILKKCL